MGERLVIVARERTELYEPLKRAFVGAEDIHVLLDRRHGERRQRAEMLGVEQRRGDRRGRAPHADLGALGFAVVSAAHAAQMKRTRPRVPRVASLAETAAFLADLPLFAGFTPSEIELLAGQLGEQTLRQGEVLFYEGEPGEEMFLVRSGRVVISKAVSGEIDRMLAVMGPGDFFGEMGLLTRLPRSATVRAESDAILLVMERRLLRYLFETNSSATITFLMAMVHEFIERLRRTNDLVVEMARLGLEPAGLNNNS